MLEISVYGLVLLPFTTTYKKDNVDRSILYSRKIKYMGIIMHCILVIMKHLPVFIYRTPKEFC